MRTPTLDLDGQLVLLANAERRQALRILSRREPPLTLRDLANALVTHENGVTLPDVPSDEVADTFARLHHIHIPKLARAGVLEYDADRRRIDDVALEGLEPTLTAITDVAAE